MNWRLNHRTRCGAALVLVAAVAILLLEFRGASMPLRITSSSPTLDVASMACTVGTNHAFSYGKIWERNEPLTSVSQEKSTVIWVSLVRPDFGIVPPGRIVTMPGGQRVLEVDDQPMPFRAQLKDINGVVTSLAGADSSSHSYKHRAWIMGWRVPGSLQSGSTIRIEFTNGDEAVTFRVR